MDNLFRITQSNLENFFFELNGKKNIKTNKINQINKTKIFVENNFNKQDNLNINKPTQLTQIYDKTFNCEIKNTESNKAFTNFNCEIKKDMEKDYNNNFKNTIGHHNVIKPL